ncbi:hypothetical protein C1Y40_02469 [Mycobacterium talmoniae]|uniref:Uncharacterized protein n=1 Tax=Mycobacterium talmoniae TaxID=1858794 RepID=A0A2S8BL43_9MYCO|nr:hypothetical protein C1Y40_02469 [Mycobacterium talmoniae]
MVTLSMVLNIRTSSSGRMSSPDVAGLLYAMIGMSIAADTLA